MVMVDVYSDDSIDLGVDSSEDTEDASETGLLWQQLCVS